MTAPTGPSVPGEWRKRRRIIHGTLLYCAVAVPALAVWRPDSPLVAQTVLALIGLAAGVIGSYVFGAVWDDANARKAGQ